MGYPLHRRTDSRRKRAHSRFDEYIWAVGTLALEEIDRMAEEMMQFGLEVSRMSSAGKGY